MTDSDSSPIPGTVEPGEMLGTVGEAAYTEGWGSDSGSECTLWGSDSDSGSDSDDSDDDDDGDPNEDLHWVSVRGTTSDLTPWARIRQVEGKPARLEVHKRASMKLYTVGLVECLHPKLPIFRVQDAPSENDEIIFLPEDSNRWVVASNPQYTGCYPALYEFSDGTVVAARTGGFDILDLKKGTVESHDIGPDQSKDHAVVPYGSNEEIVCWGGRAGRGWTTPESVDKRLKGLNLRMAWIVAAVVTPVDHGHGRSRPEKRSRLVP